MSELSKNTFLILFVLISFLSSAQSLNFSLNKYREITAEEFYMNDLKKITVTNLNNHKLISYWNIKGFLEEEVLVNDSSVSYKIYFENGNVYEEGSYKNDSEPSGIWKWYYSSGELYSTQDFNDVIGNYISYFKNGFVKEKGLRFKGGLKIGKWKIYSNSGSLLNTCFYNKPYSFYKENEIVMEIEPDSCTTLLIEKKSNYKKELDSIYQFFDSTYHLILSEHITLESCQDSKSKHRCNAIYFENKLKNNSKDLNIENKSFSIQVMLKVSSNDKLEEVRILNGSGYNAVDEFIIKEIKKMSFISGMLFKEKVNSYYNISIQWQ
ncbi:MAG: hypothetical protein CMP67_01540 [Flavobacteriales bacterium]|nr:hypothetical protein [Flavobacteriales bacterium]|tara:strand:+ start:391 stop:1359 length:969 start_codon:yes stop_codon:yes gene_type:complete